MTRSDLFAIAKKAGWKPDKAMTPKVRADVAVAVHDALVLDPSAMNRAPMVSTDAGCARCLPSMPCVS